MLNENAETEETVFEIAEFCVRRGNEPVDEFVKFYRDFSDLTRRTQWVPDEASDRWLRRFHVFHFLNQRSRMRFPRWDNVSYEQPDQAFEEDVVKSQEDQWHGMAQVRDCKPYKNKLCQHSKARISLWSKPGSYDDDWLGGAIKVFLLLPPAYQTHVIRLLTDNELINAWPHAFSRHLKIGHSTETNFLHAGTFEGVGRAGTSVQLSVYNFTQPWHHKHANGPFHLGGIEVPDGATYLSYSCSYRNYA